MFDLQDLLQKTTALHDHLCPRQVLGVRTGLLAARLFDFVLPQSGKRLFAFVETDGCYADGLSVATGCRLGHRTLRLVDCGKVAATLVDTHNGKAVRITPHPSAREHALLHQPIATDPWHAQLEAYQTMPDDELLQVQSVRLSISLESIISRPGLRVECAICGEEIMNEREVRRAGQPLCRHCAGIESYYCAGTPNEPLDLQALHAAWEEGHE